MAACLVRRCLGTVRNVNTAAVADHYGKAGCMMENIRNGLQKIGKLESICVDDLSPIDEFHIGGQEATKEFLENLQICEMDNVLDIGCGLGGPARFAATHFGCKVTGIDLTPEFINCGNELTTMVGLADKVQLYAGSALDLEDTLCGSAGTFNKAYMIHVGMNIEDKSALMSQIASQIKTGGLLGIFDIMREGRNASDKLDFPVPWATTTDTDAIASPEEYKKAFEIAGLELIAERNRYEFALDFFAKLKKKHESGQPPVGLHLVMDDFAVKMGNMIKNLKEERIAPIELIAVKKSYS